jgi:hypothetical protein
MRAKPRTLRNDARAESFVASGELVAADGRAVAAPPPARISKTIRIDHDIDQAVKKAALGMGAKRGERVTESDVIDEALRSFLKL